MRASTSAAAPPRRAPAANARPAARSTARAAAVAAAAPLTTTTRPRRRRAALAPAAARDDGHPSRRGLLLAGGWVAACGCGCCGGGAAAAASGRNSFYDGYFASQMAGGMGHYEAAIADRKRRLFGELLAAAAAGRPAAAAAAGRPADDGPLRVLEVGVGTGARLCLFPLFLLPPPPSSQPPTRLPPPPSSHPPTHLPPPILQLISLLPTSLRAGPNLPYLFSAAPAGGGAGALLDVTGLDPNPAMEAYAAAAAAAAAAGAASAGHSFRFVQGAAEAMPFEAGGEAGFDAVVSTLVLCSVPDAGAALREMRRVARPGAPLLLIEHVRSERPLAALTQALFEPLQRALADGCRLTRDTAGAVAAAGLDAAALERFELEGESLIAPHIAGVLRL